MGRLIIGIDIHKESVSAVLVRSGLKASVVEDHDFMQVQGGSRPEESLAGFLDHLADKWQLDGATVLVALPANVISLRNVQVPFQETRKIRQTLPFELETTLPQAIDDMVLDFQTVSRADSTMVITAAVEKQQIESLLKVLDDHQLDPVMITFSGYSTVSSLIAHNAIAGDTICLDIDHGQYTVFFATTGSILMVRCLTSNSTDPIDAERLATEIDQMAFAFETLYDRGFQPGRWEAQRSAPAAPVQYRTR